LLTKKEEKFVWTEEQDEAFIQGISSAQNSCTELAISRLHKAFLATDVSGYAIGDILSQDRKRPVT
jgi:hypothetical protein